MTDVLTRFNSGKLWEFDGGIHPPEMKSQSNTTPISHTPLAHNYFVPVKQHSGLPGNILVNVGDHVLKGQALTDGDGLRILPVHAPTSGTVKDIAPYVAAHPSGLAELSIHIQADGLDQWQKRQPIEDFLSLSPEHLVKKIYQAGIAGLGGAAFPTAAKIHSAEKLVKLLIINGAECEPYITCDDRLMRDYPHEIIEGIRILRYILRPEKVVIAIEDNKRKAVRALSRALRGANDIEIRVIPTKYPSGAAKQLIKVLTGMEVPSGQHSSSIGILMQNVATVFAIKRAIIDDEPLIERVVTLTGDKIPHKGNQWVRLGTPISFLLQHAGYQYDERLPVYLGGPMMGSALPNLDAPITKLANCLLAPDHFEYQAPPPEQACIRCSACSDACPVHLMPQQLYWFARGEEHEKSQQYNLMDCIECGLCAYVCPSHIPLIQYFRQEKAKIWDIQEKAYKAEEAKMRFEARRIRLEKEELARKERAQRAAAARREELVGQQGTDPVQAALERLKVKRMTEAETPTRQKILVGEKGEILPDNSDIMAQRKARRLARQQTEQQTNETLPSQSAVEKTEEMSTALDTKKAAVAAAIARAKAKKEAQQTSDLKTISTPAENSLPQSMEADTASAVEDPKKAAVAAAIARAKAKKAAQQQNTPLTTHTEIEATEPKTTLENSTEIENTVEIDPRKAAVAAAIARAKAKKAAQASAKEE